VSQTGRALSCSPGPTRPGVVSLLPRYADVSGISRSRSLLIARAMPTSISDTDGPPALVPAWCDYDGTRPNRRQSRNPRTAGVRTSG